jgi:hypothetical protein
VEEKFALKNKQSSLHLRSLCVTVYLWKRKSWSDWKKEKLRMLQGNVFVIVARNIKNIVENFGNNSTKREEKKK